MRSSGARALALIAIACGACMPVSARAQRVTGRVLEADGRTGLSGVVITLVQDSTRATPVLSGVEGRFAVRAPTPGRWQVRADAIGRPAQLSRVLTLGATDTARVELRFPPYAPTLEAVRVVAERACRVRPDESERMAEVWQSIRTALEASSATERERRTPLELEVTDYRLDLFKQRTGASRVTLKSWTGAGFLSAPPDELVAKGYVRQVGDSVAYFAPDASVITSPSFLTTHCFRVEERAPMFGARELGLGFMPLKEGQVGDVRGTLWLDPQSAALKRLELEYVVPGRTSSLPNADARIEYARLPNGRWFVSRWLLNMPVVREVGPAVGGVSSVAFSGWRAREGLARALSLSDAVRLAPPAVVMGRAIDSTTGEALVGAHLVLEGVGRLESDSAGRFTFVARDPLNVPVPAALTLTAARIEALGLEAPTRELTLVAGDTLRLEVGTPTLARIRAERCGTPDVMPEGLGLLVVSLVQSDSMQYGYNVALMARWKAENNLTTEMGNKHVSRDGNRVFGRSGGRATVCDVPRDAPVTLRAEWGVGHHAELELSAGREALATVRIVLTEAKPRAP